MYDYLEAMKSDIIDYVRNDVNTDEFTSREELEESLYDDLWTVDSVTGNGSGSYTFNRAEAEEYVNDNSDLLREAISEFCVDSETVAEKFLEADYEYFDVTIRCYLLSQAISEALDELEDDLTFSEDEQKQKNNMCRTKEKRQQNDLTNENGKIY